MSLSGLGEMWIQSPGARLALLALWSLAMAPAARAALFAPGLTYLRGWAPPRAFGPIGLALLLVCLQAPLTLMLLAAGQLRAALLLLAAGMGAASLLLARPFSPVAQVIATGLVLASALFVYMGMLWIAAAIGIVLSVWRIPRAWRDAPDRAQPRRGRAVVGGSWLALASVMLLHLWRRESPLLARCVLVSLLGVAVMFRLARAHANMDLFGPLLIATTPFLAMVSIWVALGLQRALGGMHWMTVSMSVSVQRPRIVSFALVLLACLGLALALTAPTMQWDLVAASLVHAIFWGSLALWLASLDPLGSRVGMWFVLIALIDMFAMAMLGPSTLIYQCGLALFSMARCASKRTLEFAHA